MDNQSLIKFKEANQMLEKGDVIGFGKCLIDLYDNLTCNCFFIDQKEVDYERQLDLVCKYTGEENNFYLNLAKGFIYSRIKDYKEAFEYLTKAIDIDCSCDLPYSLRSSIVQQLYVNDTIRKDLNIDCSCDLPYSLRTSIEAQLHKEDAIRAVLLNPTARNYFVLAKSFDVKDKSSKMNSLICYGKAINLRPDFACAYNNRAVILQEINDFRGAVNDYIKCIEIDKNHLANYSLLSCLKRFEKNDIVLKIIEICEKNIKNLILTQAKEAYKEGAYKLAKDLFEDYIADDTILNDSDLNIYLLSLLKNINHEKSIDETNHIYIRLDALKSSYVEKLVNGGKFSEEEENINKLMEYKSNYKIGFGNYEGQNISSIIEEDPEYVLWCIINLEHFSINKTLFLNPKLKCETLFLLALEHNLIKEKIIEKWLTNGDDYDDDYDYDYIDHYDHYDRDTFDALTDGQYGDYDDWSDGGGDFGSLRDGLGY